MKRGIAICFLAVVLPLCTLADTLPDIELLIKGAAPAKQIKLLDSMAQLYRKEKVDYALRCQRKGVEISLSGKLPEQESRCYIALAGLYKKKGLDDSALVYFDKAQTVIEKNKLSGAPLHYLYLQKGTYYYRNGDFKSASDLYFRSLAVAERINNEELKATSNNCIGNIFFREQNWDKAIEYYTVSLNINVRLNKLLGIASSSDNIGLAYSNKGDLKTAIVYQLRSVRSFEELGNEEMLSEGYYNLASTYNLIGKNDSARIYADKALALALKTGNERMLGNSYYLLGVAAYNDGDYKAALEHFRKGNWFYSRNGLKSQQLELIGYLAETFSKLGRNDSAYYYERVHYQIKSDIFSLENTELAKELSEKYQNEKKQKEIELLQKENQVKAANEKQLKTRNVALIGLAIFILVITLITYRRFTEKRKDNLVLEEKNDLITGQKMEIEEKNKNITDSIVYAQRIQFSVLPTEQHVRNLLPQSFVYYRPKDIISGDFYWMVTKNDMVYFAVADCTGHGVPGALMSMLGTSFLNQIVLEKGLQNTHDVLKELHRMVLTTLNEDLDHRQSKDGMDIALLRIDKKNKTLEFSGAGRPLYLLMNNELEIKKGDKMSIGGIYSIDETKYMAHVLPIQKGLKLYLFSDGIPDQFGGPQQKKLTVKRLQEWIDKNHVYEMDLQREYFTTFMQDWKGATEQIDDMTFVGIDLSNFA